MKRIITLFLAVIMICGFCACNDSNQSGMVGNGAQEETGVHGVLQAEVIGNFGITYEKSRIVAVKSHDEGYVEYVVVNYDNSGKKTGELSYFFCLHGQSFEQMVEKNKDNPAVQVYETERYLTKPTNHAIKGNFDQDLELLKKDYNIKGLMTADK